MKAVILDLDGLLVDTEPIFFKAVRDVLRENGILVSPRDYIETDVQKGKSLVKILARNNGFLDGDRVQNRIYRKYAGLLSVTPGKLLLVEGAREALKALHGDFKLGIATSSKRVYAKALLRKARISQYFTAMVCREDVRRLKPYPDCYLLAASRLRMKPKDCVAVEDSERGLRAAIAAGMSCIVIPNEFTKGSSFVGATLKLTNLRELKVGVVSHVLAVRGRMPRDSLTASGQRKG